MADIKVTVRVEVIDERAGSFEVAQSRSALFLGNPLLNAAEADALIASVSEDVHRTMVARYGEPTRRPS